LLFFFLLVSCAAQKYKIIADHEMEVIAQKSKKDARGFFVVIPFSQFNNNHVYDFVKKTTALLKGKHYEELYSYLSQNHANIPKLDRDLGWALYYFFTEEYNDAGMFLNQLEQSKYDCLRLLLNADISYELGIRSKKLKKDKIIQEYQQGLDCYLNNERKDLYKYFIEYRIKYIRFHSD